MVAGIIIHSTDSSCTTYFYYFYDAEGNDANKEKRRDVIVNAVEAQVESRRKRQEGLVIGKNVQKPKFFSGMKDQTFQKGKKLLCIQFVFLLFFFPLFCPLFLQKKNNSISFFFFFLFSFSYVLKINRVVKNMVSFSFPLVISFPLPK